MADGVVQKGVEGPVILTTRFVGAMAQTIS